MHIGKLRTSDGAARVGVVSGERVWIAPPAATLSSVLFAENPIAAAKSIAANSKDSVDLTAARWAAPIDHQEVWAAGVTYLRSKQARMDESPAAASVYDRVYSAERPELFFKATPHRVVGPGEPIRVRGDSRWSVPEPELALVLSPNLKIVGVTIGDDVSARDIEGENPLYLPQAKVYSECCALGPVVMLIESFPEPTSLAISLVIERGGKPLCEGGTTFASMKRTPDELVRWLGRENSFPAGVFLLTGTGVVPPDDLSLEDGDLVHIEIGGIGKLTNPVVKR